ncbi:hypothetical protein AVEN_217122-1 [Araneus ventricosus]|uniref:Uncharacterized protein n=1 Tax=Araneus ventricosus TaxID=182803 RepID=A0A4Y2E5X1_ARAVE|nr:hypothetical protein AVEN_217122-1 [Araneus ventricosus]
MRTDISENCRRCDITSLPVNEIYVVCSSKVNSWNNESTNTISFWANFSIYEYVTNALFYFRNLIFPGCDGTVVNTGVFKGVIRRLELKSNGLSAYFISTSFHYDTYLSVSLLVPRLTPETTAISSGVGSSDLAKGQPGTLNLARWLTTANRILRLYISTSNQLIILVVFTLRVYAPSWFRIKVHHSIKDGTSCGISSAHLDTCLRSIVI